MILFDAVHVNRSGGEILLDVLLEGLLPHQQDIHFLLDDRVQGRFDHLGLSKLTYLPATLGARYAFYRDHQHRFDRVFCFSGIPPMVKTDGVCLVYLQNTLLMEHPGWGHCDALKLALRHLYMRLFGRHVNGWIVQTEHMRQIAARFFRLKPSDVAVLPFFKDPFLVPERTPHSGFHFVYTSEGYPHKNHLRLFEAFERASNIHPDIVLHVTISHPYRTLNDQILIMNARGVKVVNHGFVSHQELIHLYASMDVQVFPSLTESLGLGLIESAQAGLPVIAANRPYVFELIEPTATFDPSDVKHIEACLLDVASKPAQAALLRVRSHLSELVGRIVAPV
jgi:glycosyltransferase involved in cell wall biosynthesis